MSPWATLNIPSPSLGLSPLRSSMAHSRAIMPAKKGVARAVKEVGREARSGNELSAGSVR